MKNIQTQIILIFTVLGIAVLFALGAFCTYQLQGLEEIVNTDLKI